MAAERTPAHSAALPPSPPAAAAPPFFVCGQGSNQEGKTFVRPKFLMRLSHQNGHELCLRPLHNVGIRLAQGEQCMAPGRCRGTPPPLSQRRCAHARVCKHRSRGGAGSELGAVEKKQGAITCRPQRSRRITSRTRSRACPFPTLKRLLRSKRALSLDREHPPTPRPQRTHRRVRARVLPRGCIRPRSRDDARVGGGGSGYLRAGRWAAEP